MGDDRWLAIAGTAEVISVATDEQVAASAATEHGIILVDVDGDFGSVAATRAYVVPCVEVLGSADEGSYDGD